MSLESMFRDRALLQSLSSGDADAFWVLWKRHEPHLSAICFRQMRRVRADAEDAISRSMLLARDKLPAYAHEINDLQAWLTRLTWNVCLDIKKELGRRSARAELLDDNILTAREATYVDPPSPEQTCLSAQMLRAILDAISELPRNLRDAAVMRFLNEESYSAIAAELDITEANARKRVQHARMLLTGRLMPLLQGGAGMSTSS